jgi:radical SAM protein with 4Fe4S-binding SPASM domain
MHPRNNKQEDMSMDWTNFTDLIEEIKEQCRPDIVIQFFKYNEPFAFPELLKKYTDYARKELGEKARFHIHTNGDFVTNIDLSNFSLDFIAIMDYNKKGYDYGIDLITNTLKAEPNGFLNDKFRFKKPIFQGKFINPVSNKVTTISFVSEWVENVETFVDRGGLLKNKVIAKKTDGEIIINSVKRTAICTAVHRAPSIHYSGEVMPCCHLYPQDKMHADYVLGNIKDTSLADILSSEKTMLFAEKTKTGDFPLPCQTCADTTWQH